MKQALENRNTKLLDIYVWRQRGGEFFRPQDMATRHLFYTLRMIWNHKMPDEAKLQPYNQYAFGRFYTDDYLKLSIKHLSIELGKRKDLTDIQRHELKQMLDYLAPSRIEDQSTQLLAR